MTITHYDLFAGIGGFSLAIDEVFHDHEIKHIFCEWKQFPTAVLKQHWPNGEYWGDIAELVAHTERSRLERGEQPRRGAPKTQNRAGEINGFERQDSTTTNAERTGRPRKGADSTRQHGQFDRARSDQKSQWSIVTGGFPCQPFSAAGRRRGMADDRYQWPNMFEVIRNVRPDWVIAENVRGLVTWNDGMVLETVCADLESEGYEVQPLIIPAVAVGAPHRRDRVWIIAHAKSTRQRGQQKDGERHKERDERLGFGKKRVDCFDQDSWHSHWQEVAFATCDDTVDDEIPNWMDGVIRRNGGLSGAPNETVSRQDVRDLYTAFQSEAFRTAFGRCYKVRKTEVLLEVLRQLSEDTETTKRNFQLEGSSFTEDYVRTMHERSTASRTPQEWESYRQSAVQYSDTMPELSRKATLEIAKSWYCVRLVQQSLIMEPVDNGEIKLSAAKARQASLKAYGNGIVHQVATQIVTSIREAEASHGE